MRFLLTPEGLILLTPEGREFQTREEQVAELNTELARVEAEVEEQRLRAETERAEKERLLAKLRSLGIDPDS